MGGPAPTYDSTFETKTEEPQVVILPVVIPVEVPTEPTPETEEVPE